MITKTEQSWIDTVFMALVIWREARGESVECQTAVAYSIMNRVQRPSWWGKDVMSVLFKKWQYSSMTDPHDRQLATWPSSDNPSWQQCFRVACDVMNKAVDNPVPGADGYFDDSIPPPKWATPETFVKKIDHILFYNLDRDVEK
jgi:N-acetylmuramoyl-L-alanine amidase